MGSNTREESGKNPGLGLGNISAVTAACRLHGYEGKKKSIYKDRCIMAWTIPFVGVYIVIMFTGGPVFELYRRSSGLILYHQVFRERYPSISWQLPACSSRYD